jgi:hypothetical protein
MPEENKGRGPFEGVLLDLFGTLVDFRSTFMTTLGRILLENDLMDHTEAFRDRWQRFVFQGIDDGIFITVRKDFSVSLERVLDELGIRPW